MQHLTSKLPKNCEYISNSLNYFPERMNMKDAMDRSLLHWAAASEDMSFALKLIIFKVDLNVQDQIFQTPLHLAILNNHIDLAITLIENGANVNIKDSYGNISVHEATTVGSCSMINFLSLKRVNIDEVNNIGKTSLAIAVELNNYEIVRSLTASGASVSVQSMLHAVDNQSSPSVFFALLFNEDGTFIGDNADPWIWLIESNKLSKVTSEFRVQVVEWIFKHLKESKLANIQELLHKIAFVRDSAGREAFSITDDACRDLFKHFLYLCGRYEILPGPSIHRSATAVVIYANDHDAYSEAFDEKVNIEESDMKFDQFLKSMSTLQGQDNNESMITFFRQEFDRWNSDKSGFLKREEFIRLCQSLFGATKKVVIKFMKVKEQYEREISVREINNLSSRYIVGLLVATKSLKENFTESLSSLFIDGKSMVDYHYAIVMPAADRNLDAIVRQERPDLNHIRSLSHELALAIRHLHENGIVHCDLKMLNVLRVNHDIRITDMDAAKVIGEVVGSGGKFSSGVLPPEMLYKLNEKEEEDYINYWRDHFESNSELWKKIRPVTTRRGTYVVKTSRDNYDHKFSLPYDCVGASESIDIWSFGTILFALCSGDALFKVNRDDDFSDAISLLALATLTDAKISDVIERSITMEGMETAKDLLRLILKTDSFDRPKSMDKILRHPFFLVSSSNIRNEFEPDIKKQLDLIIANQGIQTKLLRSIDEQLVAAINKRTIEISNMADRTINQILKTERVLLRGMFESTEVKVPTCFIILNQRLPTANERSKLLKKLANSSAMITDDKLVSAVDNSMSWISNLVSLTNAVTGNIDLLDKMTNAMNSLVDNLDVTNISDAVTNSMNVMLRGDSLYFYLIDEYTIEPIVPEEEENQTYPIKIETKSNFAKKFIPKVLPLMKIGLKAVSLLNTASSIGRCFGYPLPSISAEG